MRGDAWEATRLSAVALCDGCVGEGSAEDEDGAAVAAAAAALN